MIPGKALESSRISDIIRILTSKKERILQGITGLLRPVLPA